MGIRYTVGYPEVRTQLRSYGYSYSLVNEEHFGATKSFPSTYSFGTTVLAQLPKNVFLTILSDLYQWDL